MTDISIRYTDAVDKSYGVIGMALAVFVTDRERSLIDVSIDRPDIESLRFSPDINYISSPGLRPTDVWKGLLRQFEFETALLVSNVFCRQLVKRREALSPQLLNALGEILIEEGEEKCALGSDEVNHFITKYTNHFGQLYRQSYVAEAVDQLADELRRRHTLDRFYLVEVLQGL